MRVVHLKYKVEVDWIVNTKQDMESNLLKVVRDLISILIRDLYSASWK